MVPDAVKKIIIVGPAHPYRGGIAAFNERMALELTAQGVEASIITFTMQYPSLLFPGKSQYSDELQPQNIKITRGLHTLNPFNWVRLGLKIRKLKADIVILRYWMPFFAPCLTVLAWLSGTQVILLADNIIPHETRMGDKLLTSVLLRAVDAVMVLSQSVAQDLNQWSFKKPILYSPHPIFNQYGQAMDRELACQQLKLDQNKRYILFFGFIREYKGLDILLKSMKTLENSQPNLELIIAGEFYGNEEFYKNMVQDLGIETRCHIYSNFIPDDDIKQFFSVADALILPYKSATQSGVTQIAYHFNCPMIATNVGGLSEYIEHGKQGLLCALDADSLAQAIDKFYTQDLKNPMTADIKITKQAYSWEVFTTALKEFGHRLIENKNQ